MGFNINNKLIIIDSFEFLSSSLHALFINLGKDDLKYLSQEFNSKVLYLIKKNGLYFCRYMSGFESLKKNCLAKTSFLMS